MKQNSLEEKTRLLQELQRQGIHDDQVLQAIAEVDRAAFVPEEFRHQAWENIALPIAKGQTISQPYVVAFMSQALRLEPGQRVLEIGTGSGYQAAVLSRLARRVYSVERIRELQENAEEVFKKLQITNVTTRVMDGTRGWPELGPFPRILVTAAGDSIPVPLLEQLEEGGVLVGPFGSRYAQDIVRITRVKGEFRQEKLLPVRFVPLIAGPTV